jgi:hypothetical protein
MLCIACCIYSTRGARSGQIPPKYSISSTVGLRVLTSSSHKQIVCHMRSQCFLFISDILFHKFTYFCKVNMIVKSIVGWTRTPFCDDRFDNGVPLLSPVYSLLYSCQREYFTVHHAIYYSQLAGAQKNLGRTPTDEGK